MTYNQQQKLNNNIAAIRIALEWKKEKILSESEVETLKNYSGFGGIKSILYPRGNKEEWIKLHATNEDLRLYPNMMELHELLGEHLSPQQYNEAIQSIKNSVLTAFYTPFIVPQILYSVLKEHNIQPQRMYEPSSGAGIFITEAAKTFSSIQSITAVEKDLLSGRVLNALSRSLPIPVNVHITGFEQAPTDDNGKYDFIVSNIPFGNFSVYDEAFPAKELSGKIHNYFFAKGLDKISDGGLLAYITTDGFLNNPSNQISKGICF